MYLLGWLGRVSRVVTMIAASIYLSIHLPESFFLSVFLSLRKSKLTWKESGRAEKNCGRLKRGGKARTVEKRRERGEKAELRWEGTGKNWLKKAVGGIEKG